MHAIILAAGRGSRLKGLTDETPKCLMSVNGRTLLERQIDAYRKSGVTSIAVVRGYLASHIDFEGIETYDNAEWETTGLLPSLFCAEPAMEDGFLFSYGDTTFDPGHVRALVEAMEQGWPMAGVIDLEWEKVYEGRDWHPATEAENVQADETGRILRVGKNVPGEGSMGEFIGLGGVSADAARSWREAYHQLNETLTEEDDWGQKGSVRMAYTSDMMQYLIEGGMHMQAVPVRGGWREVDTPEDLERAQTAVTW